MPTKRGFAISFESIDGLGKTTQMRLLEKALSETHDLYVTKEPGDHLVGCNAGAGIRYLLFGGKNVKLTIGGKEIPSPTTKGLRPGVADLLFLADHLQNAGDVAEAVENGEVVLMDRYADSQFAYAASGTKQCPPWALKAYSDLFGYVPDMTILLRARGPEISVEFPAPARGFYVTEDISWALGRAKTRVGAEAGKQDGKAWGNDVEEQRKIQEAYDRYLSGLTRTFVVDVWPDSDIGSLHETILVEVLRRMGELTVSQDIHQFELPYPQMFTPKERVQ